MKKIKNELRSVEFTHLSAKYSLKSENSPNNFYFLKRQCGPQDQNARDVPSGKKLSS